MKHFDLVGINGNAFSIMNYVSDSMRQCGFSNKDIENYKKDATSSDYNHLLALSVEMVDRCNTFFADYVDEFRFELESWFLTTCNVNCFDSEQRWRDHMNATACKSNDFILEDALDFLKSSFNESVVNTLVSDIEDILATLAETALNK